MIRCAVSAPLRLPCLGGSPAGVGVLLRGRAAGGQQRQEEQQEEEVVVEKEEEQRRRAGLSGGARLAERAVIRIASERI